MNPQQCPGLYHFPPKGKPKSQTIWISKELGSLARPSLRWIYERTEMNIRVFRPPNTGTIWPSISVWVGWWPGVLEEEQPGVPQQDHLVHARILLCSTSVRDRCGITSGVLHHLSIKVRVEVWRTRIQPGQP